LADRGIEWKQEAYIEYEKRPPHDKYLWVALFRHCSIFKPLFNKLNINNCVHIKNYVRRVLQRSATKPQPKQYPWLKREDTSSHNYQQ
jgi:hypothetical protein